MNSRTYEYNTLHCLWLRWNGTVLDRHVSSSCVMFTQSCTLTRFLSTVQITWYPPLSYFSSSLLSVGYNDQEMTLDGQFSYDNTNQRALPFNVLIKEISGPLRTYRGSNSKLVYIVENDDFWLRGSGGEDSTIRYYCVCVGKTKKRMESFS